MLLLCVLWCVVLDTLRAQQEPMPGRPPKGPSQAEVIPPDTVFVFPSPRPLIEQRQRQIVRSIVGANVLFSQSGFGLGFFYQYPFSDILWGFVDLGISGARTTSEFETIYDPWTGRFLVPGKVNRLYNLPLTFGIIHRVFAESIGETFRPFVMAGAGPALIVSTPYEYEFFQSWKYAHGYIRPATFIGVGAFIGPASQGNVAFQVRYYYIPFGDSGLESIQGLPIRDFGGVFLALAIGF